MKWTIRLELTPVGNPPITYDIGTITRPIADLSPGQFLLQRHRGEAEKLFRQALEKRWAPAAVELYKMLESSSVSDADATLALTSKHDRPFLEEVARLFRDDHRGRGRGQAGTDGASSPHRGRVRAC